MNTLKPNNAQQRRYFFVNYRAVGCGQAKVNSKLVNFNQVKKRLALTYLPFVGTAHENSLRNFLFREEKSEV